MNHNGLVRGVAYIALAGALLATAVALNDRRYPTPSASNGDPSPNAGPLDRALARCKIAPEAAQDAACKAAWEANRERFLGSKKLYQDRVTDTGPATPAFNQPAPPSTEGQPPSRLQSPAMDFNAPDGAAGRAQ